MGQATTLTTSHGTTDFSVAAVVVARVTRGEHREVEPPAVLRLWICVEQREVPQEALRVAAVDKGQLELAVSALDALEWVASQLELCV